MTKEADFAISDSAAEKIAAAMMFATMMEIPSFKAKIDEIFKEGLKKSE